ncbi:putative membrane protein [Vibrio vulnificus]|nr:putative membrane protein [Vibrio vulnificus]
MARAKIEQHALYLMGQLVGPDGYTFLWVCFYIPTFFPNAPW